MIYWFYGLPSSGKTTLVKSIMQYPPNGIHLDGDILREGVSYDLGFSKDDREENLRRATGIAKLLHDQGHDVYCSFITPYEETQDAIKQRLGGDVMMIHVKASLQTCVDRDTKGLYERALDGEIRDMTGIQDRFDIGEPDVVIDTENQSVEESTNDFFSIRNYNERPHLMFIGRWNPLHNGHKHIMLKKHDETGLPLLILVRNTDYDKPPAWVRKKWIERWMLKEVVDGEVILIPDIEGVYYGRKVGYNVEEIDVPEEVAAISGTDMRRKENETKGSTP
jgi:adenylylsulfate kinase